MSTPNNNYKNTRPKKIDTSLGHVPPQAVDIEQVVLGALMIDCDAFGRVSEFLCPEAFYDSRHQKIYQAIQTLSHNNRPVDIMTVAEELSREGTLEQIGGAPYVVDLSSRAASSANIEYHARILAQKQLGRNLISYASDIETKAFDPTQDVEELMQEAEGSLFELSKRNMRQDYKQIISDYMQSRAAVEKAASTGGITGISSGYYELDHTTAGWQQSDLIIIAGRPAMGKTALAVSIAKNTAFDNQIPMAFFSLEMSGKQISDRLISNICSIPGERILSGQLNPDEWGRFDNSADAFAAAPLYVDDTPGLSVFELRTKARRLVKEKGVKLIMIDYLQLMTAPGMKYNTRQEEVSNISRSIKGLAKELNIPIIALSQLSRAVEQRTGEDGKRPVLSDLRESGSIEQDADMVIFVHRPEYYHIDVDSNGNSLKGKAQLIIAKHRKGATKDVTLDFTGEYTRFTNLDEDRGVQRYVSKLNLYNPEDSDKPF